MTSGIHVNFTSQELESEARTFDALPTGEYKCFITEMKEVVIKDVDGDGRPNKNAGKKYWNAELTVSEGKYEKRKMWTNIMLFDGALYSLVQLLKATGNEGALQSGQVPEAISFVGKEVVVVAKKQLDEFTMKKAGPGAAPEYKTEVKGFKPVNALVASNSNGGGTPSLLP